MWSVLPLTLPPLRLQRTLERQRMSSDGSGCHPSGHPRRAAWDGIKQKCVEHLGSGGSTATLPHANKIWMLFGFELFSSLRAGLGIEVIEVYPFAIVRALLSACQHKSTEQGYRDQLVAVAARTGWRPQDLEAKLRATVPGSRHDRLDAFMAAWVASLAA